MPKVLIKAGDFSGVDAAEGFNNYAGPTPPKGLYRFTTKLWRIKKNKNGDQMFMIVFEVNEPKGSKNAKYNGYACFHNANLTEQSAPYVNAMLDALGLSRKAVWVTGVVTDPESPTDVTKVGGKSAIGIDVMGNTKRKEYPAGSGEFQLEIKSFLPAGAAVETEPGEDDDEEVIDLDDDSDDGDEGDDDEEPF